MDSSPASGPPPSSPATPPPLAFTQGAGWVFQVFGGTFFLITATICCGSSLLSKEFAERRDWTTFGWHWPGDEAGKPSYSAQRAISVAMFVSVGLGLGLAGTGLGMQATRRHSAAGAVMVAGFGMVFWMVQALFTAQFFSSVLLVLGTGALAVMFAVLMAIAAGAWQEMRRHPPAEGHEVLPKEYKIPYSHYHEDPPDVRLEKEIEERRQRLEVQRKELEMLEEKVRKAKEEKRQ